MTKDEIEQAVVDLYQKYEHIFLLANIEHKTFFDWFAKFRTYGEMRRANSYLFGGGRQKLRLLMNLQMSQQVYKRFDDDMWEKLGLLARDDKDFKLLMLTIKELKQTWVARPKPRRSHS